MNNQNHVNQDFITILILGNAHPFVGTEFWPYLLKSAMMGIIKKMMNAIIACYNVINIVKSVNFKINVLYVRRIMS